MGSFLMLLAVLMKLAGILQMQLFQINQSEESSKMAKITINAHTTSCYYTQYTVQPYNLLPM